MLSVALSHDDGACRFVQILDAHPGTIYRLAISPSLRIEPKDVRILANDGNATPDAVRLWDKGTVLSIKLSVPCQSFSVLFHDEPIARMTPRLHSRLIIERDLSMVNPSIDPAFHHWITAHDRKLDSVRTQPIDALPLQPLISIIVPLYRTPIPYFHDMITSVLQQTYPTWELVLVNASPDDRDLAQAIESHQDARIRVVQMEKNLGIAGNTNAGIRAATGAYIAFFDHDDMLDTRALEMYVRALNERSDIDLFYCDEDNFHETLDDRYSPLLKPDFNLDLLYSHNYVVHLLMASRHALDRVELSPDETSGAQDYDLTLKVSEVARRIEHVPYILYHWRAHAGSTNGGVMESKPYAIAASVRALHDHFARRGLDVSVTPTDITCVFDADFAYKGAKLSIICPVHDDEDLQRAKTAFSDMRSKVDAELIAVGPFDSEGQTGDVALVSCKTSCSFETMANTGAQHAFGKHLLICKAIPTDPSDGFLERLSGCLERPEVGIAAPKLLYPDSLVQQAGVAICPDGSLHFLNQNFACNMGGGYHGYSECSCDYSAIGPECFMIRTSDYLKLGGLDESYGNSLVAMADMCLKLREQKKLVVVLPHAIARFDAPVVLDTSNTVSHYGSVRSVQQLWKRWGEPWRRDALFNPHVTFERGYPQLDDGRDYTAEARHLRARAAAGRFLRRLFPTRR